MAARESQGKLLAPVVTKRTIVRMRIVVDTNVPLVVAMNGPEREWLLKVALEADLIAPPVLPYEVANALSAWVKRKKLSPGRAEYLWDVICGIPVELVEVDVKTALMVAVERGIYVYDAFFLQCARESVCPLLTLDSGMRHVARVMGIRILERP